MIFASSHSGSLEYGGAGMNGGQMEPITQDLKGSETCANSRNNGDGKILLVIPNDVYRQKLGDDLKTHFHCWRIDLARDGKETWRKIRDGHPPKLILLDIALPGENSLVLTRKIKLEFPRTTLVLLSGADLPEYREAARLDGADYFVPTDSYTGKDIVKLLELIVSGCQVHPEKIQ